jgi:hypothetical protein
MEPTLIWFSSESLIKENDTKPPRTDLHPANYESFSMISKINQNQVVEIEEGLSFLKNKVILPG